MEHPPPPIQGANRVLAAIGHWPSFNHAEVLSLLLQRSVDANQFASIAVLVVRIREYKYSDKSRWDLALKNDISIEFRFTGLEDVLIAGFDHRNFLDDFSLVPLKELGKWKIVLDPTQGVGGSWVCREASIAGVEINEPET